MMTKTVTIVVAAAIAAGAWSTSAQAVPTEAASVNTCQNAVRVEAAKFLKKKVAAVDACLQAISTQLVKKGAADESKAAKPCVAQFRKLNDTRGLGKSIPEKLQSKITAKCAGVTTLADILGGSGATLSTPLDAQDIATWCGYFGGSGTLSTLNDWISCVQGAQACAADTAISTQYPQALTWLTNVRAAMNGLTAPSNDLTKISDAVAGLDEVVAELQGAGSGNTPQFQCGSIQACGNNRAEGTEVCDGTDLRGQTCATQAPSTPYGTLGCQSNCLAFDTSGCIGRFTDNGDGTVTDHQTGLMWEQKTTDGSIHDTSNTYTWSSTGTAADGTAFTDFLPALNGTDPSCGSTSSDGITQSSSGFAGYCDWRLPTIAELRTIVDLSAPGCGSGSPCIDPVFSNTQSSDYWSSTTYQSVPAGAWVVDFNVGDVFGVGKSANHYVRAVRGGS